MKTLITILSFMLIIFVLLTFLVFSQTQWPNAKQIETMTIKLLIEYVSLVITAIGAFFVWFEFKKKNDLNAIDKFISYRNRLKDNPSLCKIIVHIQEWQSNDELKFLIPNNITLFDFYYFLGFYEEIYILIKNKQLDKQMAKDMFAFYAIEIADNCFYWKHFKENYQNDNDWGNFKSFIELMKKTK